MTPTEPTPAAVIPAAPPPAAAAAPGSCSGPGWDARRGEASLASPQPTQPPGYPVMRFKPAMEGFYGQTKPAELVVELYVRDCSAESDALLRYFVAHEIGHSRNKPWLPDPQPTS